MTEEAPSSFEDGSLPAAEQATTRDTEGSLGGGLGGSEQQIGMMSLLHYKIFIVEIGSRGREYTGTCCSVEGTFKNSKLSLI